MIRSTKSGQETTWWVPWHTCWFASAAFQFRSQDWSDHADYSSE
ncbi:MAG: hypothetical protein ACR2NP_02570 [Pirellulaceae bacterium]